MCCTSVWAGEQRGSVLRREDVHAERCLRQAGKGLEVGLELMLVEQLAKEKAVCKVLCKGFRLCGGVERWGRMSGRV